MMKPDLSEFSYGFALTSEIVTAAGGPSVAAPQFPTLPQEGHLGYDVNVPACALFLQFKLSDFIVSPRAHGADRLGVPHYRMHLRPLKRSAQHSLLLALEKSEGNVYYAAPAFHTTGELNQYYLARSVEDASSFWKPSAIGALDDEDHFVAFTAGDDFGFRYSEPKDAVRVERTAWEQVLSVRPTRTLSDNDRPGADFFGALASRLVRQYVAVTDREPPTALLEQDLAPFAKAALVSLALFDSWLFVVQPRG